MASRRPLLTPGWTKTTQRHPKRCAPQATLRPWLPSVAQVTVISRVASLCLPSARSAEVAEGDGGTTILVTDTGIGMAPADIPRAFEAFTQLDSSLSRRFSGSGLGLYLSRALAEAQGATLTLDSVPGAGTTAVLHFPKSRLITPLAA